MSQKDSKNFKFPVIKDLFKNKFLLISVIVGVLIFSGGLVFSLTNTSNLVANNNTTSSSSQLSSYSLDSSETSQEEFEYDYEGLYLSQKIQEQGFETGLLSSINNSELGFDYPVELTDKQKSDLEEIYPETPTKTLDDLLPAPQEKTLTSRLVWPEYGIDAPLVHSSLLDLFNQENGVINFNSYVDNNPIDSPIQTKLTQGVVHLAYTPLPGEIGNSYIVGHSSNFSSVVSDYNEVFAPLTRATKVDEIFTIYDHEGRELKFRVFEAVEVRTEDTDIAYNNYPKDKRVVTLQGSILERVDGRLEPTKRWLTRGELIVE
jgi:hypothetical protein